MCIETRTTWKCGKTTYSYWNCVNYTSMNVATRPKCPNYSTVNRKVSDMNCGECSWCLKHDKSDNVYQQLPPNNYKCDKNGKTKYK